MTRPITDLLALREGITPGPWQWFPQEGRPGHCTLAEVFADGEIGPAIAHIEPTEPGDTATATARAIAALPELFDALERMKDALLPFAQFADALSEDAPGNCSLALFINGATVFGPESPSIDDLRRARAALANRSET